MNITTTKPTAADLARVAGKTPERAAHILLSDAQYVCAYDNDKLVGVAWFVGDGVTWLVLGIHVSVSYQKKGVGLALREAYIHECEKQTRGKGRIYGFVNEKTKPFWEKLSGFQIMGRHYTGYYNIRGSG